MEELFNFNMKMAADDREMLEKLSEIIGESKSTVIRMGLREQGRRYGLWPKPVTAQPATETAENVAVAA